MINFLFPLLKEGSDLHFKEIGCSGPLCVLPGRIVAPGRLCEAPGNAGEAPLYYPAAVRRRSGWTPRLLSVALVVLLLPGLSRGAEEMQTLKVRRGGTLREIARVYLSEPGRWNELLRYNRLPSPDPDAALPAMSLNVPSALVRERYRAARLVYVDNAVLLRRADSSDWKDAYYSEQLFPSDALRTRGGSRAGVRFYNGEFLRIASNSLVVLRQPFKASPSADMLVGVLHSKGTRVVTRTAVIVPKTRDTEFDTSMDRDLKTVVSVTRGAAEVEAQGRNVEVTEGYRVEVMPGLAPTDPFKPSTAPAPGEIGYVVEVVTAEVAMGGAGTAQAPGGAAAPVPMAGARPGGLKPGVIRIETISMNGAAQGAHVQVSRSRDFSSPVLDKKYMAIEEVDLNQALPAGEYFYRMAPIDLLGFEGKFTGPRPLRISGPGGN